MRRYSSRAAPCSSGKPSKPSACEKRTTVELEVFARRASSSAVWKATSSRWSTMYCATSFWDRENSSNRAWMYAERVWCPLASWGGRVVVAALFMGDAFFDGVPGCSSPATTMRREPAVNHDAPGLSRTRLAGLLRFRPEDPRRELGGGYVRRLPLSLWITRSSPTLRK